ncbi:hypothetical protein HN51_055761 [Arachis hypogaea]|uniref:RNase P Rpr2/Rpp21 subunit domain protein n=1 Tax=Arachis hypogaea TaxID=3818 RepID=A0A6B9VAI5_ARAHY|nr:uncharacterized protein LOC107618977 [Arachis ipaensis]XP_020968418.1 uncharacterized protein LOC107618977 [Arachis ipaensis]XP_020968419.1 uncharacterized protein LOC107618977 [Arachis ipaensis]XP_025676215.1 uncharacterized protein LOC112776318 [Arachis hypogaea]XP_025676216.1 uncharacterized protein LOC112776318 [Arachis hypogaea]XP_025676217.1 uncharacterized protein LOC112776318 [Arachis hypogaea]QHN78539.1 RNase P Rpr2/Rpp21 subunit domain protein [Arachis hypogaea]QHN78540.1 RNase 
MGKQGGGTKNPACQPHTPVSLREEATGKIHKKPRATTRSLVEVEHLEKIAVWASHEAQIPSLGAFYGQRLATVAEANGITPDSSLITCHRCETVLHPGINSTVRIEKNRSKHRGKHKHSQNNVVYKCHFCLHHNVKRGTPKGHMKGLCPSKTKTSSVSTPATKPITHESSKSGKGIIGEDNTKEADAFASSVTDKDVSVVDSPATPSSVSATTSKKRKSKKTLEASSASVESEASKTQGTASKKRKRSWTSLKKLVQSNDHDNSDDANLKIPFLL